MLFATRLSAGHGGPSSMSLFLNTSSSKNETFSLSSSTSPDLSHVFAPLRGFNSTGPSSRNSVTLLRLRSKRNSLSLISRFKPSRLTTVSSSNSSESTFSGAESAGRIGSSEAAAGSDEAVAGAKDEVSEGGKFHVEVRNPSLPIPSAAKLSLTDRAFFLLAFIACTTSVAFTSLVVAAVPTLYAMGGAATSLSKLADTACEELPSTMAAISQEIADGVSKATRAVQAAEARIQQIGALARQRTMSIIEGRASMPISTLQPVVVGVAKKTSRAVGQAAKPQKA